MNTDLVVLMATHKKEYVIPYSYIIPIQVGASLTNARFAKIMDNQGESISEKNPIYSELTALYWLWKNCNSSFAGLCHYRRFFDIDYKELMNYLKRDMIIVPYKMIFRESIKEQYVKCHGSDTWNAMLSVLKFTYPNYYESAEEVFSNNKLYPFNMFVASRQFVESYCEWVFNILFKVERFINVSDKDEYQKRFAGFLSERLFTLYLYHNSVMLKEIKVINTDKKINYVPNLIKNSINTCIFNYKKIVYRG